MSDNSDKKQSLYVKDFMTEEEEKAEISTKKDKDIDNFEKSKENFDIEKILSGFVLKKSLFIQQREGDIEKYYNIDPEQVGEGAYGVVYKATEITSGEVRAIKVIQKSKIKNYERFINEITALRTLDHPNVIKLYEMFEDDEKLYLVQEF